MSDAIRVTLNPDRLHVQPDGEPVESQITIQNVGATVDQYAVELDQLPTSWYSLSNTSVALFPQDKEEARLVIHPPKGGAAKAGTYPFTVTVLSRADPSQTTRADGILTIGAVAAFEMSMTPNRRTGRKGRYTLTLRNGGNADLDVALEATDQEEACRYKFRPKAAHLAAGQKTAVRLTVKARRNSIAGVKKNHDFTVKANPNRGEAKSVQGQLAHKPIFRTWRPVRRLAFLFVLIAIIVVALLSVGGISGARNKWDSPDNSLRIQLCTRLHVFCVTSTPSPSVIATVTPIGTSGTPGPATPVPPEACALTPGPSVSPGTALGFVGAFKEFHDHAAGLVGNALEQEQQSRFGDVTQRTTEGMLLYDHNDGHSYLIKNDCTVWAYYHRKAGIGTYEIR